MVKEVKQSITVLLVEDREADVRLTQEALKSAPSVRNLYVARDGVEAMAYLRKEKPFAECREPDLILLDLNLPKKSGREVLGEIKQDPELRTIPVIVLTTSCSGGDIEECYRLHANCYIVKPVDMDEFIDCVRAIENFWFGTAKLPSQTGS